jgi:hypothetical protein
MANDNDEISLKDLVLKVKAWIAYLKTKWLIILIVGIIGGALGFFYAYFSKPKYTADLTFVLSSNSKSGSLASLAGQFGFDVGGSNDDEFAGDNIIELLKSYRIIKGALFRQVPDSSKSLINILVQQTKMQVNWQKKERFKNLLPFPDDPNKLTPIQDSLVSEIHDFVVKNYLTLDKTDKKLAFYKVSATTPFEPVSFYLTQYIVDEASKFYVETKTLVARQNLNMLEHEADSLRNLLGNTITATASANDEVFNLNPAYQVQRSSAQQHQIRATVLGTAYGEVIKNLEIAKITLQKETPLYQKIDEPSLPLKVLRKNILFSIIFTFLLYVIGDICFVLLRKVLIGSI